MSLGSDLRNQVICQEPLDLIILSTTFEFNCFVKNIWIQLNIFCYYFKLKEIIYILIDGVVLFIVIAMSNYFL